MPDDSSAMPVGVVLVMIVIYAVIIAAFVFLYVRIIRKTGYSGWWVLAAFVPLLNLVMLVMAAVNEWPIERRLAEAEARLALGGDHGGYGGYGMSPGQQPPAGSPYGQAPSYGQAPPFGQAPPYGQSPSYGQPSPYTQAAPAGPAYAQAPVEAHGSALPAPASVPFDPMPYPSGYGDPPESAHAASTPPAQPYPGQPYQGQPYPGQPQPEPTSAAAPPPPPPPAPPYGGQPPGPYGPPPVAPDGDPFHAGALTDDPFNSGSSALPGMGRHTGTIPIYGEDPPSTRRTF